jgi:hypothetical protein
MKKTGIDHVIPWIGGQLTAAHLWDFWLSSPGSKLFQITGLAGCEL